MITDYDAIVLAGGRGSRLRGPAKPEVRLAGRRLLDIALAAATGARRVVVVGDVTVPHGVLLTREEPPFGGPVAGVEAGFAALGTHAEWTLLLACDLPDAEAAVARLLLAEPGAENEGACLRDIDGRPQWLLGCYRSATVAARLEARGDPPLTAMHRLLSPLNLLLIDPGEALVDDLDTPEDVEKWASIITQRSQDAAPSPD